eukprot:5168172-Prymnesium_polylepis.1
MPTAVSAELASPSERALSSSSSRSGSSARAARSFSSVTDDCSARCSCAAAARSSCPVPSRAGRARRDFRRACRAGPPPATQRGAGRRGRVTAPWARLPVAAAGAP